MFCGACGKENVAEDKFCTGCGKPLAVLAHVPNGRYSVILQSVPPDEFERFRLIKQLAGVMALPESQAKALVESAPSIVASTDGLEAAENLQKRLSELTVETLVRPVGQEQLDRLREQARLETQKASQRIAPPHRVPTYEELAEMGRKVEKEYEARTTGSYIAGVEEKNGLDESIRSSLIGLGLFAAGLWLFQPVMTAGAANGFLSSWMFVYVAAKWLLTVAFVASFVFTMRRNRKLALNVSQVLVGAILTWVIVFNVFKGCVSTTSSYSSSDRITVLTMAQELVKDTLAAPSTARFPWPSEHDVRELGGGRYSVSSYVDSQNVFGAMVRTHYTAIVQDVGDGKWRLENLDTH